MVNVVTGGNETGQALVEHPDVRMVSLTGSTGTGKKIMATAAATLKRVHLELGGKAPVIVFDDADVELVGAKAALPPSATPARTARPPPASMWRRAATTTWWRRWSRPCAAVKVGDALRR